jgi:hypothetical protein
VIVDVGNENCAKAQFGLNLSVTATNKDDFMAAEGSYQANTYNLEFEGEIQRLKAQVLLSWEKEARTLKWFGLADGMNVLEAGSGPGFFTEKLL